MSTLSNIISTLKAAGLSGTTLTQAIQTIAGASPTAAIQANCTTILANASNPAVVKDMATKIAEISNLPPAVAALLPGLTAATTPEAVVEAVRDIETALTSSTGSGLVL